MNAATLEYLWEFAELSLTRNEETFGDLACRFFSEELDLPRPVDDMLIRHFSGNENSLQIVQWIVESFAFSGTAPELHLALVAELFRRGVLTAPEAAKLVRLDHSSFSLLSEQGREVVRTAELLDEDDSLEAQAGLVIALLDCYGVKSIKK